ncbi:hypothetical protein WNY78_14030 [Psychroserpens sp. AS72]|uniref:hypothetical protein n=1 Tax=Psychroserpens sp. AS72 TaxID=3135775 RepID=UPI003174EBE9
MKKITVLCFILLVTIVGYSQEKQIDQSKSFENVLLAIKTDSILLFKKSFSRTVNKNIDDNDFWNTKFNEVKKLFQKKLGDYNLNLFTYHFIDYYDKLVVYYNKEEVFDIDIIYEDGLWKLLLK